MKTSHGPTTDVLPCRKWWLVRFQKKVFYPFLIEEVVQPGTGKKNRKRICRMNFLTLLAAFLLSLSAANVTAHFLPHHLTCPTMLGDRLLPSCFPCQTGIACRYKSPTCFQGTFIPNDTYVTNTKYTIVSYIFSFFSFSFPLIHCSHSIWWNGLNSIFFFGQYEMKFPFSQPHDMISSAHKWKYLEGSSVTPGRTSWAGLLLASNNNPLLWHSHTETKGAYVCLCLRQGRPIKSLEQNPHQEKDCLARIRR